MLAESNSGVVTFMHLVLDVTLKHLRLDKVRLITLQVALIKRIAIVVLLSVWRSPPLNRDQVVVENLSCVDLNEASVIVISDSASVVTFSYQILGSLPGDRDTSVKVRVLNLINILSHVDG